MIACLTQLLGNSIALQAQASAFEGNRMVGGVCVPVCNEETTLQMEDALWRCSVSLTRADNAIDGQARFALAEGTMACGNVSLLFHFSNWSAHNYVLLPAAAYNGNRYRVVRKEYPPFLHQEDCIGPDMPVTITDVPRLALVDGPSYIHLRSGDMATPAVGVHAPGTGRGFLLLFDHNTAFGYTGLRLEESPDRSSAKLWIEAPAVREAMYTMAHSASPSDDCGVSFATGDILVLKFRILLFDCPDIDTLFRVFFDHRKDLAGSAPLVHGLPLSAAYRIIERKYNETQYNKEHQYYMLSPGGKGTVFGDWQAGWCGGGLNSLALYYDGNALSKQRANATMDSIFGYLQNKNGYILPIFSDGKALGDDFYHQNRVSVLLVRKNGDVMVFAARYILLAKERGDEVPLQWLAGLRKLADAFVRLWNRYGQFGQFIDIEAEEILQGGTACGSIVSGGLALAWAVLGDGIYLEAAEASAQRYYEDYVRTGLLNGGPGEILQNPDSESASNMLESFVALYELTGSRKWLPMAEETARICATWVVSYNFIFPAQSCFGTLGMRTLGSVYANTQNKHSAPGFCTLSGASLLRLYRATGEPRYLEMIRETAHNITQYLSREDRPLLSWEGKPLPAGWMCERVNMSDWEGKQNIGGVFHGSCWCEISCMLSYAELPGVWFLTDTGEAIVIDHVDAMVSDDGDSWKLFLSNPTGFGADVKLLCEPQSAFCTPWRQSVTNGCQIISVAAGGAACVSVRKAAVQAVL